MNDTKYPNKLPHYSLVTTVFNCDSGVKSVCTPVSTPSQSGNGAVDSLSSPDKPDKYQLAIVAGPLL